MDADTLTHPVPVATTVQDALLAGNLPRRLGGPPPAIGLALATLEALLGRRGLYQLRPWLSPPAFLQLVTYVDSGIFERSMLGRLRTQMPTPLAVEATARISVNARWLACTLRLDREESWRCTDLMVLGARGV